MGGRACTTSCEASWLSVVHVGLMVRAVEVLAIPASTQGQRLASSAQQVWGKGYLRREVVDSHYSARAGLSGELHRLGPSRIDIIQASVAKTRVALSAVDGIGLWTAHRHSETLKELT